ncbi:MAG: endolytic transglycosylase MltG [Gammaproteobacteria bacterium]
MRKLFAIIVLLVIVAAIAGSSMYSAWLETPVYSGSDPLVFEVARGDSMRRVAAQLGEQTGYSHPELLSFYAQRKGLASQVKAGEFEIPSGVTPDEFLEVLISGKVVSYPLTLIEGWTFAQMRDAVGKHPAIEHTVTTAAEIMSAIGQPDVHPEGRFYPDTYLVTKGQRDVEVYRKAFNIMTDLMDEAWSQRDQDLPLKSAYEALILASIIEKETGAEDERPEISGVFNRRLRKGMRLQTDPTVIYGVGDAYRGDITRKHLTTDTPYNTYTRSGLPPTPIALPGRASLFAAVAPKAGKTLYFVATGSGDGRHFFSATLKEHNEAVQRYLARTRGR